MWTLLLTAALAEEPASTDPREREVVTDSYASAYSSSGIVAGGLGFVLGVAGDTRRGGLKAMGEVGLGGRTPGITGGIPSKPGIVLGSASLVLDVEDRTGPRLGATVIGDFAVVDAEEQDCDGPNGCRHYMFVRAEGVPVGMAVSPAIGVTIEQSWDDGLRVFASLALQDHRIYGYQVPLGPRSEVLIATPSGWELGAWLRRHGIGLRIGFALGQDTDPAQ